MSQTAWLIDSSIYVFKAWHTSPEERLDINGNPIGAVLGFLDFVYRLLSTETPSLIAFGFDESLKTSHRKEIYPDYKANRSTAPESLRNQFRLCREFLRALGIHEDASKYYEADDLIGTWAASLRKKYIPVCIISADKDLAQLIYENDCWWEYDRGQRLDKKALTKKFRAKPRQIADQLAIAGDKSDNIPGVPGIGMSTAAKLLRKFDNIETLLSSIPEISLMKIRGATRIQALIEEYQESIILSRKLTGIRCDIKTVNIDTFEIDMINERAFYKLCDQLILTPQVREKWLALHHKIRISL